MAEVVKMRALLLALCIGLPLSACQETTGAHDPTANQKVAQRGAVGCVNEDALDEFRQAVVNNKQADYLFDRQLCVMIEGLEYSLVDTSSTTARIRVTIEQGSTVLWTMRDH